MEHSNKKLFFSIVIIFTLLLTGCSKFHFNTLGDSDNQTEPTQAVVQEDGDSETINGQVEDSLNDDSVAEDNEPTKKLEEPGTSNNIQPTANTELMIYSINADTLEKEAAIALIPKGSEITPELIVNTVVESMADKTLMIGIDSVETKDDAIIVSFSADKPPVQDVGAGGLEGFILDAIAQSLLENLDNYSKVIYRIEGGAYVTDHIELGIDEVYLGDN